MNIHKGLIIELIEKALEGKLTLDELYSTWPESLEKDGAFEIVYDLIESAIEHYPSSVFSNKLLESEFKKSVEYKNLFQILQNFKDAS